MLKLTNICKNCQVVTGARADRAHTIFSYGTPVLSVDCSQISPKLVRHWDGYSVTTMRHINQSLEKLGMEKINKKIWQGMEVIPV